MKDTKYRLLNIVALNGSSFIAKRHDPGPCPGRAGSCLPPRVAPADAVSVASVALLALMAVVSKASPGPQSSAGMSITRAILSRRE
jgi:hypothetical protein